MYNTPKPNRDDLPSTAQLIRSTLIAVLAALVILITIILPSEYGIDPTGLGEATGLTEMGQIKQELAEEAAQDQGAWLHKPTDLFAALARLLIRPAHAQDSWTDTVRFDLTPGATKEIKLVMTKGAVADYRMTVTGGRVNFDLHADGNNRSVTYEKGRGSRGSEGQITAAFDGNHGWFWRNRDKTTLTVILELRGAYSAIKTVK